MDKTNFIEHLKTSLAKIICHGKFSNCRHISHTSCISTLLMYLSQTSFQMFKSQIECTVEPLHQSCCDWRLAKNNDTKKLKFMLKIPASYV